MRKIRKQYIIALIFTLIGVLVCQNLYALRVPMTGYKTVEKTFKDIKESELQPPEQSHLTSNSEVVHSLFDGYSIQFGRKQENIVPKFYDLSQPTGDAYTWAQMHISLKRAIGSDYVFNPIIHVIRKNEFELLVRGTAQRGKALVRFLQDIYGGSWNVVKEGIVPEIIVEKALETQGYKELVGKLPPSAIAITYGPDLYYHNGYVIEDNIGYLGGRRSIFELHKALRSIFPGSALVDSEVLEQHYAKGLKDILPIGDGGIAYWEDPAFKKFHDFSNESKILKESGILFVGGRMEGENRFEIDEHEGLFVITPDKQRVKIGYLNYCEYDFTLDPDYSPFIKRTEDLGYDKICNGIPGIISLVKKDKLLLGHSIGSSLADSKLIYPFVEKLIRFYLKEEPIFKSTRVFALNEKYGLKRLTSEEIMQRRDDLVLKPIMGERGVGVVIGRFVDNNEWEEALERAFDKPDDFLLFEYVEPLHIGDYITSHRPIIEIMPDLETNVYPGVYARTKHVLGDGVIGFGRAGTESMIVLVEGISISDIGQPNTISKEVSYIKPATDL
ncbi:MAG: circularly permuted type 2 ATP-grasp protein [Candidatus Omnitrophota bacterium]